MDENRLLEKEQLALGGTAKKGEGKFWMAKGSENLKGMFLKDDPN